jgi:hypothetical protein
MHTLIVFDQSFEQIEQIDRDKVVEPIAELLKRLGLEESGPSVKSFPGAVSLAGLLSLATREDMRSQGTLILYIGTSRTDWKARNQVQTEQYAKVLDSTFNKNTKDDAQVHEQDDVSPLYALVTFDWLATGSHVLNIGEKTEYLGAFIAGLMASRGPLTWTYLGLQTENLSLAQQRLLGALPDGVFSPNNHHELKENDTVDPAFLARKTWSPSDVLVFAADAARTGQFWQVFDLRHFSGTLILTETAPGESHAVIYSGGKVVANFSLDNFSQQLKILETVLSQRNIKFDPDTFVNSRRVFKEFDFNRPENHSPRRAPVPQICEGPSSTTIQPLKHSDRWASFNAWFRGPP